MNTKPKISVNIIVKDEEQSIANAINSVKSFADEIIVIDTGSNDSTPEICTRLGCEVFHHQWNDNFSQARNTAIGYSRGDWIFVIDADEVALFSKEDLPTEQMSDRDIGGINLEIVNHIDSENESLISKHRYTRLFRRDEVIRFTGSIHEQIRESVEEKFEVYESNLQIEHFGYQAISEEKLERNTRLLNKDLEEEEDDWKYYHLAETYFSGGNTQEALKIFEKIENSSELTDTQQQRVKIRLGQIYLGNDKYDEATRVLDFQSEDKDNEGLRQYVLAAVKLSKGSPEEALKLYKSHKVELSDLVDKKQLKMSIEGAEKVKKIMEKSS
jgi:glycosyltransferase involved in cell wall biosynthesis